MLDLGNVVGDLLNDWSENWSEFEGINQEVEEDANIMKGLELIAGC